MKHHTGCKVLRQHTFLHYKLIITNRYRYNTYNIHTLAIIHIPIAADNYFHCKVNTHFIRSLRAIFGSYTRSKSISMCKYSNKYNTQVL